MCRPGAHRLRTQNQQPRRPDKQRTSHPPRLGRGTQAPTHTAASRRRRNRRPLLLQTHRPNRRNRNPPRNQNRHLGVQRRHARTHHPRIKKPPGRPRIHQRTTRNHRRPLPRAPPPRQHGRRPPLNHRTRCHLDLLLHCQSAGTHRLVPPPPPRQNRGAGLPGAGRHDYHRRRRGTGTRHPPRLWGRRHSHRHHGRQLHRRRPARRNLRPQPGPPRGGAPRERHH